MVARLSLLLVGGGLVLGLHLAALMQRWHWRWMAGVLMAWLAIMAGVFWLRLLVRQGRCRDRSRMKRQWILLVALIEFALLVWFVSS